MVPSPELPASTFDDPSCTSPALQGTTTVQVVAHSFEATPMPPRFLVVVIATVQVPVRTHASPATLHIAVQGAQAIAVHTNAFKATPHPLSATVEAVVEVVFAEQSPVATDGYALAAGPAAVELPAIPVAANALVLVGPEPTRLLVVVIVPPRVPVRTTTTPFALNVAIKSAVAIQVNANSPVPTPGPL